MINPEQLKRMADEWLEKLPGQELGSDVKLMLKAHFQQFLTQANLVTREEFDIQVELLQRTQAQLKALEQQLDELTEKTSTAE